MWESLAICEYVAELFPTAGLWPEDRHARAAASSIAAEMHAGFSDLRKHMPMDIARRYLDARWTANVAADIRRVTTLWTECRARYGAEGPFLFGTFTIADAMYAPVATRFITYTVALEEEAQAYVQTLLALSPLQSWMASATTEVAM